MRILRRIIIMLALAANGGTTAFANSSELPDTLKVNNDKSVQLKEVVVESVRRKDIAEGIAFFRRSGIRGLPPMLCRCWR